MPRSSRWRESVRQSTDASVKPEQSMPHSGIPPLLVMSA